MVFPFGVSVGDFIAGIDFILKCVKAVDDIRGGSASYQQLVSTLEAFSVAMGTVGDLKSENLTPAKKRQIRDAAEGFRRCTNTFLRSIDKYGSLKASATRPTRWSLGWMKVGLKKINWSLNMTDDVSKFQRNVTFHLTSLGVLLSAIQIAHSQSNHNTIKTAVGTGKEEVLALVDHRANQQMTLTSTLHDCIRQQGTEQRLILDAVIGMANQQQIFHQALNLSIGEEHKVEDVQELKVDRQDLGTCIIFLYQELAKETFICSQLCGPFRARNKPADKLCAAFDKMHMTAYGLGLESYGTAEELSSLELSIHGTALDMIQLLHDLRRLFRSSLQWHPHSDSVILAFVPHQAAPDRYSLVTGFTKLLDTLIITKRTYKRDTTQGKGHLWAFPDGRGGIEYRWERICSPLIGSRR